MSKKKRERSTIMASDDLSPVGITEETVFSKQDTAVGNEDLDDLLAEEAAEEKLVSKILPSSSNSELKEKIETLEKHCVELEEANARLTDSINTYLEEIDALKRSKANEIDGKEESVEDLKKALDAAISEVSKLKRSEKELREENDSYLIKISELTFENAKMTSQLQELSKSLAMSASPTHRDAGVPRIQPSTATIPNQPQFANPYLKNGYRDW